MTAIPKVFISYSHDNDIHKQWVYNLACGLVENGIDTILDQWDVQLGSNLIRFMEHGLSNSDRVLVVCTDSYNKKSNDGFGGVGYEKIILTGELFIDQSAQNSFRASVASQQTQRLRYASVGRLTLTFRTMPNSIKTLNPYCTNSMAYRTVQDQGSGRTLFISLAMTCHQ